MNSPQTIDMNSPRPLERHPPAPTTGPRPLRERIATARTRFEPYAYSLLRIVAGALFFFHGAQKILGWVADHPQPDVGSQMWIGGIIELVGGALISLGLFTRVAAFLAAGQMAVAYFQFHWKLDLADWHWLPIVNKGELAVLYCFLFPFVAMRGAGRWSLDGAFRRG